MKNIIQFTFTFIILTFLFSCSKEKVGYDTKLGKPFDYSLYNRDSFQSIAEIYYEHGNFINSRKFPPIISAKDVFAEKNNYLLIDIRDTSSYAEGHIIGAYSIAKDKVIDFLINEQKAAAYQKVILIDDVGQIASYVTGILRYAGFDNTYVMLFGMAAWNPQFSKVMNQEFANQNNDLFVRKDKKGVGEHEDLHGTHVDAHHVKSWKEIETHLPKVEMVFPSKMIIERAKTLLNQPENEFLIHVDQYLPELKDNPNQYYTFMYYNKKGYDKSHLKGADFYAIRKDLGADYKLSNLPKDKTIVVYGKTGHTSGNATAYLDMLGYDVRSLEYGKNALEYDKKSGLIDVLSNNFPLVKGKGRYKVKKKKAKIKE